MRAWGMLQGLLLLLMLAGILLAAALTRSKRSPLQREQARYRNLPWLLALFLPIAMLLALWIKLPYASHADFRFIYPMLVPLLYFASLSWGYRERWHWGRCVALIAPSIGLLSLVWLGALLFY
jgi:heme A synthase